MKRKRRKPVRHDAADEIVVPMEPPAEAAALEAEPEPEPEPPAPNGIVVALAEQFGITPDDVYGYVAVVDYRATDEDGNVVRRHQALWPIEIPEWHVRGLLLHTIEHMRPDRVT